jgi:DNA sulfur modification protein DndD
MLGQTAKTLEQQTVRAERQAAAGILHEAAARLERDLIAANVAARTLQLVRDWATREKRVMADGAAATFPDAGSTLARLRHLLEGSLGAEVAACRKLLARHADASARLDELDRSLAMTPDADAIQDSAEARRAALVEVGARQQEHVAAEAAANEITREVESRRREMDKLIEANRIARGEASDGERFVRHATGVKLALDRFGTRLRRRHLERLEKLILECYRALVHKSHLARGLRIDPNTYTINLTDGAAMEVRPERLSAGERQLLAVSILWGMARASGRPLPVAIDTPLGRLDGIHRRQLVERYFPHAAGQVILLSTDEEVDAELHALLGPFIGRAYRLNHDEMSGTQISVGYPFASEPIPKDSQHLLK